MQQTTPVRPLVIAGVLLGIGLGGFVDGIVFHQILQWHHMLSNTSAHPTTTIAGLEANTLADGLFHAATWLITVAGLAMMWRAGSLRGVRWNGVVFVGALLLGWAGFNLVEGIVNHELLRIHHVRDDVSNKVAWDLGFLAVSAAVFAAGAWLVRRGASAPVTSARR